MRRLPPWMLGGASTSVTATSNRMDNKSLGVKRKHEPEVTKTKDEKRPKRTVKAKERDSNLHGNESDEPTKVRARKRGRERKIREEAKCSDGENSEIIQPIAEQQDEDLTVDDLLSFAQEYLQSEDQTRSTVASTSRSRSMIMVDESNSYPTVQESNIGSSKGTKKSETSTIDSTTEDMLDLLLGPLFKKPQQ